MATSKVAIANRALQALGVSRKLESLDQDHPNARTLKLAFDAARDALLRRYTWGFAKKRDSIAADADQTAWGEHNRYTLPNDFIRLIRDNESGQQVDWKIEGQFIVTDDAAPLDILYIARIDDPNAYDSLFAETLSLFIAMRTCEEITQSTSKMAAVKIDFNDAVEEAKKIGAIEKEAQEFPEDEWLTARL